MGSPGKDPQWREAERFAERHARTVLARLDVRVTNAPEGAPLDLLGVGFAARVEHQRHPVQRAAVEQLHDAAGTRTAVFYSRSGFDKTAVLWADDHRVALFGYADEGYAAPFNERARELVRRGQSESDHEVRVAVELVARYSVETRREARRRESEVVAEAIRAEDRSRREDERRRVERLRDEAVLARTLALLLLVRVDPSSLQATVARLAGSTAPAAVADAAPRLTSAELPVAVGLVRALVDEALAAFALLTPTAARGGTTDRVARRTAGRALDALDAALGVGTTGHVAPEAVVGHLHEAERCWRSLVAALVSAHAAAGPTLPTQRVAPGAAVLVPWAT